VIVVIMAPLGLVDVGADVRVRVGEPLAVTMQIAAERLIGEGLVDHPENATYCGCALDDGELKQGADRPAAEDHVEHREL
jgi:hypothetical protein